MGETFAELRAKAEEERRQEEKKKGKEAQLSDFGIENPIDREKSESYHAKVRAEKRSREMFKESEKRKIEEWLNDQKKDQEYLKLKAEDEMKRKLHKAELKKRRENHEDLRP